MANSKALFNKQKELRDYLSAIVHSDQFKQCLIYVRGELMEAPGLTPQGIDGAKAFQSILLDFTDEEPESAAFPGPELHHDLDNARESLKKKD